MKWKRSSALLLLGLAAASVRADTIKLVATEIKDASVLQLKQNVATFWATNLLAAQAANPELNSLDLSIAAVLKAISIEQWAAGLTYCNLTNCEIVNAQSLVAIDPNASVVITPTALDFGDVPVTATPEPEIIWLLALGTIGLVLGWSYKAKARREEQFE